MVTFKTIRQTAAMGLIPEHYLRLLVAQGKCPGIRSGNRFLINVEALAELLDAESRRGCEKGQRCPDERDEKNLHQRGNGS